MNYTTYGNEIWYKARDNSEKTAVVLHSDAVEGFTKILDSASVNFYGFNIEEKGISKLTVLKNDLDFVKQLVGSDVSEKLRISELKEYIPPEHNIFGTVSFKDIEEKAYLSCRSEPEKEAILKTAQMLSDNEIEFSGRVYPNRVTFTYEKDYEESIVGIYNAILSKQVSARNAVENEVNARLTFYSPESVFETELLKSGFSKEQTEQLMSQPEVKALSQLQVDEYEYISYLNPKYTYEQNIDLLKILEVIADSGGFNMVCPSEAEKNLYIKQKDFDLDVDIRDFLSDHFFSEEQKSAIRFISNQEKSVPLQETIDETFSADDIYNLYELFSQAKSMESASVIIDKINDFLEIHRYNLRERDSVTDFTAYMLDTLANSREMRDICKSENQNLKKIISEYIDSYVRQMEHKKAIFPGYTKTDIEDFVWEYNVHSHIREKIQDSVTEDLRTAFSQADQTIAEHNNIPKILHDHQLNNVSSVSKEDIKTTVSCKEIEKTPADKLKELTERLEQGLQDLFESDRYKEYLSVMSKCSIAIA